MASQWKRLIGSDAKPHRPSPKLRRRRFEQLEPRQMMHGGGLGAATSGHLLTNEVSSLGSGASIITSTAITKANLSLAPILFDPRTLDQQMGLPMLDSNPGAPATLYLDFNGNTETGFWYYDGSNSRVNVPTFTTPVFDTDGNTASFSAS